MAWLWKTLVFSIGIGSFVIALAILGPSLTRPKVCGLGSLTTEARKDSVQSTKNIYGQILGDQDCAPNKLVVKLPVIQKDVNISKQLYKENSPDIATILTVSNQSRSLYVRRIDLTKTAFKVSSDDSCIGWKWKSDQGKQILSLTLERNLQIHDPNISKIYFLVVLPVEMKKANTSVSIQRSVLPDYGSNRAGDIFPIKLKDGNLKNLSDLINQATSNPSQATWMSGKELSQDISKELSEQFNLSGVYIDKPVFNLKDKSDAILPYEKTSEKNSCELPKDF
jgi:hypothetical protein